MSHDSALTQSPGNLGFVFDDTGRPVDPGTEALKKNITDMFQLAAQTAQNRLSDAIQHGQISGSDSAAHDIFLADEQRKFFAGSSWMIPSPRGGDDKRNAEFQLTRFPKAWLLLDLDAKPFSTSAKLKETLEAFGDEISAGHLNTGVATERGWATAEVSITQGGAQIQAGYIHVTACQNEKKEGWRHNVKYIQVTSTPTVVYYHFDNEKWENRTV